MAVCMFHTYIGLAIAIAQHVWWNCFTMGQKSFNHHSEKYCILYEFLYNFPNVANWFSKQWKVLHLLWDSICFFFLTCCNLIQVTTLLWFHHTMLPTTSCCQQMAPDTHIIFTISDRPASLQIDVCVLVIHVRLTIFSLEIEHKLKPKNTHYSMCIAVQG